MRFITLATLLCLVVLLASLFTHEVESSHIRKLRLAKRLAKLMLKGKHGKILLALPFPLPIPLPLPLPLPVVKKIPLPSLLPSLQSLLPALTSLNAWSGLSGLSQASQSWSALPAAAPAWPTVDTSSWGSASAPFSNYDAWSAPVAAPAWPSSAPVAAPAWPTASSASISTDSGYQAGQSNYQESSVKTSSSYPSSEQTWSSNPVQQEVVEQKQTSSGGY